MRRNKDIQRFKRDARAFGVSAAGHIPHFGKALGIYDTVQKGQRLAQSTPRAINALRRNAESNINRKLGNLW
jgi:hypothetical protein